jgi:hypothetical protein
MDSKTLGKRSSYQLKSLASRIKAIHHAMTAEELADLLSVSRLTILRRAKRGTHSILPCRHMRQVRPREHQQMACGYGGEEDVSALSVGTVCGISG